MTHPIGSLVTARGRDWVVQPGSDDEVLLVRPVSGSAEEATGIVLAVEGSDVHSSRFDLPDPEDVGDFRKSQLLRDAVRLGFRASAGPFRSFGRIAVDPRPYQLVPLLMALKMDPVRLLIADDVGIGKTIESLLIARELLDQGTVSRMSVLCTPQLAEQWQREMKEKFHLDAELVLPGTAARLERGLQVDESLFDLHPITVVSTDYIKSDRRRHDFLNAAPELIIVDEAHTCVSAGGYGGRGRTQRHELLRGLAADEKRHMLLVTATPHSGKHEAFVRLLGLLDETFLYFPDDLTGSEHRRHRERLARHFVQRRRPDVEEYLGEDTPFPERYRTEETYLLDDAYRDLFDRAVGLARDTVRDKSGGEHRQRVRWWSMLALLRSMASSPAAAASTLRNRARVSDAETAEEADRIGRATVLDQSVEEDSAEALDVPPGADPSDEDGTPMRRKLLELARAAEAITPEQDTKLRRATAMVKQLLQEGFNPILFCRFIPTAEYVADALRDHVSADVAVEAVTGMIPASERELRIEALGDHEGQRVLVATDCLSEGINLQRHFNAVIHYDLAWNPTRHEQREGRVDRFGQPCDEVRLVTFYGEDNRIDLGVKRVLLDKHDKIRRQTGVAVPVPDDTNSIVESLSWQVLLSDDFGSQLSFEDLLAPEQQELFEEWERVADLEKRSKAMFAQHAMRPDEVAREVEAARTAIGSPTDVQRFVLRAISALGGTWQQLGDRHRLDLSGTPAELQDALHGDVHVDARFEMPVSEQEEYLTRSHPLVETLASHILDAAMDPLARGVATRSGALRTADVDRRITLVFVRYRFDLVAREHREQRKLLAEDCRVLAFAGPPAEPEWLEDADTAALLDARPGGTVTRSQATQWVSRITDGWEHLEPHVARIGSTLAEELRQQHERVRDAARERGVSFETRAHDPADVLGVYVLVPTGGTDDA